MVKSHGVVSVSTCPNLFRVLIQRWLISHPPETILATLTRLGMKPVPCEGHAGPCPYYALWATPAETQYEYKDPTEPDPNRPLHLCPTCSEGYVDEWKTRWNEYYGSVL